MDTDNIFKDFEIISMYTDDQAVSDGVLADISSFNIFLDGKPVNRITGYLYDELMRSVCHDTQKLRSVLKTKLSLAAMPKDDPQDGYFYLVPLNLWAVRNEVGGYTLMFPEDY